MNKDLISRADAIALPAYDSDGDPAGKFDHQIFVKLSDLRALPAYEVEVRELEWVDFEDRGAKAQAWNHANYMIQKWSDGRYEISASYPGHSNSIAGIDHYYPSMDAAKAAAQADYAARIRSAMTAAPAAYVTEADILAAAGDEYVLEHPMETDWHRMGRTSTVRGMMVRLGLYPKLEEAIDAAIARMKETKA